MATQAERRRQVVAAVRQFKRLLRSLETAANKASREVNRLETRKTLIGPDSLKTLSSEVDALNISMTQIEKGYVNLRQVAAAIPV